MNNNGNTDIHVSCAILSTRYDNNKKWQKFNYHTFTWVFCFYSINVARFNTFSRYLPWTLRRHLSTKKL